MANPITASEITWTDTIDVASLTFSVSTPDHLEGPGLRRWMDVVDSERELVEFRSKCQQYGFPTTWQLKDGHIPTIVKGVKSCDAIKFKITCII